MEVGPSAAMASMMPNPSVQIKALPFPADFAPRHRPRRRILFPALERLSETTLISDERQPHRYFTEVSDRLGSYRGHAIELRKCCYNERSTNYTDL
jgi:hypothetical protein